MNTTINNNPIALFSSPQDAEAIFKQQLDDLIRQQESIQAAARYCRQLAQYKVAEEKKAFDALAEEYLTLSQSFQQQLQPLFQGGV